MESCLLGDRIRLPRGQRRDLDTLIVPSVSPAPRSCMRHPRDVVVIAAAVVAFLLEGGR